MKSSISRSAAWLERLCTGQVASVESPTLAFPAAGGDLARDRQDEADVMKRPFLPRVSNVEQNLQNDVDFRQARSSSQ